MQEGPVDTELAADETAIFPAVMDGAGAAALYSWRPVAGGGTALWRRLFTGAIKTKATVAAEALTESRGGRSSRSSGRFPASEAQHALIGWAENTPAGAVLGIAIIRPTQMRVVRSSPSPASGRFCASGLGSGRRPRRPANAFS